MAIDTTKRDEPGVAADLSEAPQELVELAETASQVMVTQDTGDLDVEWILLLDCSRSMYQRFKDGQVQKLANLVIGAALASDADGEVPLIPFDDEVRPEIPLTAKNASGIIEARVFGKPGTLFPTREDMGSTNLSGALREARTIIDRTGKFTIVCVIGDGQPNGPGDPDASTEETIEIGRRGGFVKFVALDLVQWLKDVDELEKTQPGRREYDNVHAVAVKDPAKITPQEFYRLAMKGLPEHIKGAQDAGYLN